MQLHPLIKETTVENGWNLQLQSETKVSDTPQVAEQLLTGPKRQLKDTKPKLHLVFLFFKVVV